MFGDIRALQELSNFDSHFIDGIKGVEPCTFINKVGSLAVHRMKCLTLVLCVFCDNAMWVSLSHVSLRVDGRTSKRRSTTFAQSLLGRAQPTACPTRCSTSVSLPRRTRTTPHPLIWEGSPASARSHRRSTLQRVRMPTAHTHKKPLRSWLMLMACSPPGQQPRAQQMQSQ